METSYYYSIIGAIALIIHCIFNFDLYARGKAGDRADKWSRYFTVSVMAFYIADILWGVFSIKQQASLLYVDTMGCFFIMACCVVSWCNYVTAYLKMNNTYGRVISVCSKLFAVSLVTVISLNYIAHFLFGFDENLLFQKYFYRHIIYGLQMILFLMISIQSLYVTYKTKGKHLGRNMTIALVGFVMVLTALLQDVFLYFPVYSLGLFIDTCLIYVFVQGDEKREKLEQITKLNDMLNENQHVLEQRLAIIQSMGSVYFSAYYVNLEKNTFIELSAMDTIQNAIAGLRKAQESLIVACEQLVVPEYKQRMLEFCDLSTVQERMRNKKVVSCEYIGATTGWSRALMIEGDRNENGDLRHLFFATRTIHDEKNKELEQTEKLEEYANIVSNAGIGIWTILLKDGEKPRMQADAKMKELLGEVDGEDSDEEVYEKWYSRIFPESLSSVKRSVGLMMQGNFDENTYLWNHPTKGRVYARCGGTGMIMPDGTIALKGYHSEVTDIVLAEETYKEELAMARQEAIDANNAKTAFLFNMSHDIRTPMNAIIGFRDLLEKNQEDPARRQDYLQKIEESSNVLLSIINNVLEMARIEKGSIELVENAWGTEQFSDILFSLFAEMMEQKGITFTKEMDVRHPYVYCDPIKLREVFINILSNSYKYTQPGGSVKIKLVELPSDKEGWVLYQTTVSDTGIGMSENFLEHVFEEFSRENRMTDNKIEGTGLGMPIVKRLVELMDGTVEVQSKKGEGTTIVVTIPHRIAPREELVEPVHASFDATTFIGKRVLLAEDNELNAEIATEILKEMGFVVEHAADGKICVDMLKEAESGYYDVILMDIQMPNMDGYKATRIIRKIEDEGKNSIPIIAMTANAFEEDKRDAIAAGMNAHLAKPVDVAELMRTLAGALAQ